ncbi:hypothetical protein WMY93_031017 [Mugilogobius chulae]|uniref:Uncharacterized protein n=1 Tax=Mugilogobius chulae TaxID=88201 RepID=A0AAW0MMT4_9GOBI
MLPIHLQMNGTPQLGQMGAAPYLITSQSPMSLPLVLEQQVLQHMGPSVIPQSPNCAPSVLCQGALPFALSPGAEQKTTGQSQDTNLLSLLQNPAFAAILQDLFPSQTGASGCQSPASPFFSAPPLTPPYSSPLAPLVPPATLLVPYPSSSRCLCPCLSPAHPCACPLRGLQREFVQTCLHCEPKHSDLFTGHYLRPSVLRTVPHSPSHCVYVLSC